MVRPVVADHQRARLTADERSGRGSTALAPIRLRVIPHHPDAETVPSVASLRPRIINDLVADVTALLASDAQVDRGKGPEQVQPADIAVLVRTNVRGEQIRDALVAAGVPAVMHGASSVFGSAGGPGLADPADRPRPAPAAGGPTGRADLLLRLDLRRAGPGQPRNRRWPTSPSASAGGGGCWPAEGSRPCSRRRPPTKAFPSGCWPPAVVSAG